jgi:16S rRNA (cytosine967-C5)-methyltransferase
MLDESLKAERSEVPQAWRVSEASRPVREWPGFGEGKFFVQDVSSQLLVAQVSEAFREAKVNRVLDLCAAPGGKSVGLAWNGFDVVASDIDSERLGAVRENVQRLGSGHSLSVREKPELVDEKFDGVWVDAPCTGSGILRRHPDVRWLKQNEQVRSLNVIQRELLLEACQRLKSGGVLVYSVCSVLTEEGSDLVKGAPIPGLSLVAERELSPVDAPFGDGFYLALFRKA